VDAYGRVTAAVSGTPVPTFPRVAASVVAAQQSVSNQVSIYSLQLSEGFTHLLRGTGPFAGVNTGFVEMDCSAVSLYGGTFNAGPSPPVGDLLTVYITPDISTFPGGALQTAATIYPAFFTGTSVISSTCLGKVAFELAAFRAIYGTPLWVSMYLCVYNVSGNPVYPGQYAINFDVTYAPAASI
jgi:hypothetical protein